MQNTLNTIGADAKIAAESLQNRTFLPRNVSWQKRIKLKRRTTRVQEVAVEEIPSAAGEANVMEETPIEEVPSDMEETPIEEETIRDGGDTD